MRGLQARVEKLEAEQESTPSIGAQIVAILEARAPGPRLSEEELARTKMGRLLLERRRRAELDYQG
jgi:hypothetical protein